MCRYIGIVSLVVIVLGLACDVPQDPRNASNAEIAEQTIEDIPDDVAVASTFKCSVKVQLPQYIDSFAVFFFEEGGSGERVVGDEVGTDTIYPFAITFRQPAEYRVVLYLYRNDKAVDSFADTFTVLSVVSNETVSEIPDSIPIKSFFQCSVSVRYPDAIDSFAVVRSDVNADYSRKSYTGAVTDSLLVFDVSFPDSGSHTYSILFYCDTYVDSVTKTSFVFSTIPVVSASETNVSSYLDDSLMITFTAEDPDSNLLKYILSSDGGLAVDKQFLAGEQTEATVERELPLSYILALQDTVDLISFSVMDEDSQYSSTVLCTLQVVDTIKPEITSDVATLIDSIYTVSALPDTLTMNVTDNWHVDSVKFGGEKMPIDADGTVAIELVQLDSGTTLDSIEAWDRAGNRKSLEVRLYYSGPMIFQPDIAPIFQTVNEGSLFDTVYLDDKVTITDTAATYTKDSLRWSVETDTSDSGMHIHFDSLHRTLYVQAPEGEIHRDRIAVLSVTVVDPAGISKTQHGATFLIIEKDDPPRITLKGQNKTFGTPFDTLKLDTCGFDPEGANRLIWTIKRGTYFYPDSIYTKKCIEIGGHTCFSLFSGRVAIVEDTTKTKNVISISDTLTFTLKSVTAGDTATTSKKVPFVWRASIIIPLDTIRIKRTLNP